MNRGNGGLQMHPQDRTLELHLAGSLGMLRAAFVKLHLRSCANCRLRMAEVGENIKAEAELKEALAEMPDPGTPPPALTARMAACANAPERRS